MPAKWQIERDRAERSIAMRNRAPFDWRTAQEEYETKLRKLQADRDKALRLMSDASTQKQRESAERAFEKTFERQSKLNRDLDAARRKYQMY